MDNTEAGGDSAQLENTSVLFWDFFGYRAQGTAAHFAKHLADFLHRHSIQPNDMQLESEQPMHCAVRCTLASPSEALAVAQTLKASARSQLAGPPQPTELKNTANANGSGSPPPVTTEHESARPLPH